MKKVINMKKILFLMLVLFLSVFTAINLYAMPNPWSDCGDDMYCGAKKAGFNMPLRVNDYNVRAMEGLLEITFPIDKKRNVTVRKTVTYNLGDISGVYESYPINKTITLKNGIIFNVRGDKKRYYVANFAAENAYYSIYCKEGLKLNDINNLYAIIAEAEAPIYSEKSSESIETLQNKRTFDGIVEPVYTQDCFPKTLQKKGVTKECFERANLGDASYCSSSQIIMIKQYYRKGYKCDPLNDGNGNYCAE